MLTNKKMISKKHHYLPKFYLKGFTNESGKFSVYDYNKGYIKNQEFDPSTHFFQTDRNTVGKGENKSDFPETHYSKLDNKHSKLIQNIQKTVGPPNLDLTEMLDLELFFATIFWRIPQNDSFFNDQYEMNSIFNKAFIFRDSKTGLEVNNDKTELIKNSIDFKTSIRSSASILDFLAKNTDDLKNWRISYGKSPLNLCSDSPIIFKEDKVRDIFKSEFIFPISQNHLLVRTLNELLVKELTPEFNLLVDIAIFKQGKIYCVGANRKYLEHIVNVSKDFPLAKIKYTLFEFFYGRNF